jgi:hypothetical protein
MTPLELDGYGYGGRDEEMAPTELDAGIVRVSVITEVVSITVVMVVSPDVIVCSLVQSDR